MSTVASPITRGGPPIRAGQGHSFFWRRLHSLCGIIPVGWSLAFYVIGITAASWHFASGLYLFSAKWGITVSDKSRQRFGWVCVALAITLIGVGLATVSAFFRPGDAYNPPASTWESTSETAGNH